MIQRADTTNVGTALQGLQLQASGQTYAGNMALAYNSIYPKVRLTLDEIEALHSAVAGSDKAREALNKLAPYIEIAVSF